MDMDSSLKPVLWRGADRSQRGRHSTGAVRDWTTRKNLDGTTPGTTRVGVGMLTRRTTSVTEGGVGRLL